MCDIFTDKRNAYMYILMVCDVTEHNKTTGHLSIVCLLCCITVHVYVSKLNVLFKFSFLFTEKFIPWNILHSSFFFSVVMSFILIAVNTSVYAEAISLYNSSIFKSSILLFLLFVKHNRVFFLYIPWNKLMLSFNRMFTCKNPVEDVLLV